MTGADTGIRSSTRRVSVGVGAALFLLTVAAFFRPPLLPDIGRDIGFGALGIGLLSSAFALGRLGADFPAGWMSDRMSPGPMMVIGSGIVAGGCALLVVATGPGPVLVAMLVLGIGSAWVLTTSMAHFARAPKAARGTAMSIFAACLLGGQSFGPTIGGLIGGDGDWRRVMVVGAALSVLVGAGSFLIGGERPNREPARSSVSALEGQSSHVPWPVLMSVYLIPAAQFSIAGAVLQTLVPIVGDAELDLNPAAIGLALGLGGLCRLVAAIVSGRLSDRVSRRVALVPGQLLQLLGVGVFMLGGIGPWYAAIALLTLGSAGVNLGATILADLSEERGMGNRLGAFRFSGDAAFLFAPLLAGWLYEIGGRAMAVIPSLLIAIMVVIGVGWIIPETHRR